MKFLATNAKRSLHNIIGNSVAVGANRCGSCNNRNFKVYFWIPYAIKDDSLNSKDVFRYNW